MTPKQIADTILDQLNPQNIIVLSWGARDFRFFEESKVLGNEEVNHIGGLCFKVNGRKYKGMVWVALAPNDTYVVKFGKFSRGKFIPAVEKTEEGEIEVKALRDVYCDQLHEFIDHFVET